MGVSFSPTIIKDGLACYLDAQNPRSYNPSENLLLQSEAVSTSPWGSYLGGTGQTITVNQVAGPFGGAVTADLVSQSTPTNSILQGVTVGGTVTLTASVYVKAVTATSLTLTLWRITGGTSQAANIGINPTTGGVISSGGVGVVQASCVPIGNGWFRVQLTSTGTDALNTTAQFELYNYTAGASSYYVWGAQLERNFSATPYTPTTTAQVTRGSVWYDLSGNNRNFTWNSFPQHNYAGTSYFKTVGNIARGPASNAFGFTDTGGYTIFLPVYCEVLAGNHAFKFYQNNIGTGTRGIAAHVGYGSIGEIYYDQGGCCNADTRINGNGGADMQNAWSIIVFRRNNAARKLWRNKTELASMRYSDAPSATLANLNTTAVDLASSDEYGVNNPWQARLGGFIVYNRGLTDNEVLQNVSTLRAKYGVL